MPEISVVVVTCNSEKYIGTCLDSLVSQTFRDFETIVVDNGSADATVRLVKEKYPFSHVIGNRENAGACKARNQGIEKAAGNWILTLDCDVVLHPDFLNVLAGCARNAGGIVGAFQPKVYKPGGKNIYSFGIDFTSWGRFYDRGRGKSDTGQFDGAADIFGACSAAAFYRKSALDAVRETDGVFDERFFFLVEDVDLSLRMRRTGWKTVFAPGAVCYHCGNSSGFSRQRRQFQCWRNRKLLMVKNRVRKPLLIFLYDGPRFIWLACTNCFSREHIFRAQQKKYER